MSQVKPMQRFAFALVAVLMLVAADRAAAVHVNPQGLGQVLLFPYYTVNRQQQTYISIVNADSVNKAFQLTIRESYNSREVFNLTVFLGANESWSATLFATDDLGTSDGSAALMTADRSCTLPDMWTHNDGSIDGRPYRRFSIDAFDDGGPQSATRTREGHIEVVALADYGPGLWFTYPDGRPRNCEPVRQADFTSPALEGSVPRARLFGAGAIIDVGQGTYYPYRPVAIADFSRKSLIASRERDLIGLINEGDAATVTARVASQGPVLEAVFPLDRAVDAFSAVLTQAALLNEYLTDPALGAGSDWVVTFPTKRFYTDPALLAPVTTAIPPFETPFSAPGESCVDVSVGYYDRPSGRYDRATYRHPPLMAPILGPLMCRAVNVLSFQHAPQETSAVLGSTALVDEFDFDTSAFTAGWAQLDMVIGRGMSHALRPALQQGDSPVPHLMGLPAIGFWAMNLVNGQVADGVLANYGGTVPHSGLIQCWQCPSF